MLAFIVL